MANKTVKKDTKAEFDFSNSYKAIKNTVNTVNSQLKEVASDVREDLKDNGAQLRERTIDPMMEVYDKAYDRITETVNMENISKAAKDANAYAINTAEEIVDAALENGEKWQTVATKAVKGGLKLASKQQDIIFDTLETVKGQLSKSTTRFRKLFSNN